MHRCSGVIRVLDGRALVIKGEKNVGGRVTRTLLRNICCGAIVCRKLQSIILMEEKNLFFFFFEKYKESLLFKY